MLPYILEIVERSSAMDQGFLRILKYISVRSSLALVLAFFLTLVLGNGTIGILRRLKAGQFIRHSTGENAVDLAGMHGKKQGTPTMGGILIIIATMTPAAIFCDWRQSAVPYCAYMALGFASVGFWDDYLKVVRKNSKGLSAKAKLIPQILLGLAFGYGVYCGAISVRYPVVEHWGPDGVAAPFFKNAAFSLGAFYILFAAFVLTASSNSVNLTDGLDGLAIGITISAAFCLVVAAYLAGRKDASAYLLIPHVAGAGELSVMLSALIGGSLGFLWFNAPPASVFMGDTGSMMLGGMLGAAALLIKQEFILAIAGGIFVAEAVSVILQVASFRIFKKRVFLMSPLHHHYERLGLAESKIMARFWIVSILLALAGLSALKIR